MMLERQSGRESHKYQFAEVRGVFSKQEKEMLKAIQRKLKEG